MYTKGGAHTRRCTPRAVHRKDESCYFRGLQGLPPASSRCETKQGLVWQSTGKAVHTCVRCTQMAVYVHCRNLLSKGGMGLASALSEASRSKGRFGGPQARQCIYKAVRTLDGAHEGRCTQKVSSVILEDSAGLPSASSRREPKHGVVWRCTGKGVHVCLWCTQRAVCGYRRSVVM